MDGYGHACCARQSGRIGDEGGALEVEGPGEEKDNCGRSAAICGFNDGEDAFGVVSGAIN